MCTNKSFFGQLLVLLMVMLAAGGVTVRAQDSLDSDEYREDYARMDKIKSIPAAAKRGEQLLLFIKERPNMDYRIMQHVNQLFLEDMKRMNMHSEFASLRILTERAIKQNPMYGDAYLFCGFALKGEKKMPEAINAFAKAYVLRSVRSKDAKKELDNLYKETHKGSLLGEQDVIDAAKRDLIKAQPGKTEAKKKPAK
jgi:hypothetical protein